MVVTQPKTDIVYIPHAKTACDGDSASGHPRVFLTVNSEGNVDCPYCGKHYVLEKGATSDSH